MRLQEDYNHYCRHWLKQPVSHRTWDRMIAIFDLEHCRDIKERWERLQALAEIRSVNSRIKMDLPLLQRYQMIRSVTSKASIEGADLLRAVRQIKYVSESQFRVWCRDGGVEFGRRSIYQGEELWRLLGFISLRMPDIEAVVKLARLVTDKQLAA